jgi:uncharacterized membrane protein YeaQ/YmgE (transglycosylase-associated protein family)
MPSPVFVFAFVVATLMGAIFHFIFGGDARRMALFLLAGWLGFALGQAAGSSFDIAIYPIGELRIIPAIIGALFTLISVLIFTSERRQSRSSR